MARNVTIEPVLNGFVCQVGCQRVVYPDVRSLARAVEEYYNHPEEVEARYRKEAVNRCQEPCPLPTSQAGQQCDATSRITDEPRMEGRPRR